MNNAIELMLDVLNVSGPRIARAALRSAQVAADCLVFYPAGILATAWLVFSLCGATPVTTAVSTVYQWADVAVRSAPYGMVIEKRCPKAAGAGLTAPCDSPVNVVVDLPTSATETTKGIAVGYAVLVGASGILLLLKRTCIGLLHDLRSKRQRDLAHHGERPTKRRARRQQAAHQGELKDAARS